MSCTVKDGGTRNSNIEGKNNGYNFHVRKLTENILMSHWNDPLYLNINNVASKF